MRSILSAHKKKQNQAKYEITASHNEVNNVIADVKEKRKRTNKNVTIKKTNYDRKKSARASARIRSKLEI